MNDRIDPYPESPRENADLDHRHENLVHALESLKKDIHKELPWALFDAPIFSADDQGNPKFRQGVEFLGCDEDLFDWVERFRYIYEVGKALLKESGR